MTTSGVIPSISIESLLAARDAAHAAFEEIRRIHKAAADDLAKFDVGLPGLEVEFPGGCRRSLLDDYWRDAIRREIDRHVWLLVFRALNIDMLMDSATRKKLQESLYRDSRYSHEKDALPELTAENIRSTWDAAVAKKRDYFEDGVEAVYRHLCWDYKTNTPGLIGETLIVNFHLSKYECEGATCSSLHCYNRAGETLLDLERVLALLDGQPPPTHLTGVSGMREIPWGEWTPVPSTTGKALMSVKVYRKGSLHVRIPDPSLVRALNGIISKRYPAAIGTGDRHKGRAKRQAV